MLDYHIRPFKLSDGQDACALIRENIERLEGINSVARLMLKRKSSPEQLVRELEGNHAFVIEDKGRVSGIASLKRNKISRLFIAPLYQNRGMGSSLLQRVVREVHASGFRIVEVDSSLGALRFYQRRGFRSRGIREVNYEAASFRFAEMTRVLS